MKTNLIQMYGVVQMYKHKSIQREIYSKISFHLGKLEKEEQSNANRGRKETIRITAEINEIETKSIEENQ